MKRNLIIIFLALTLFGCKEKETDPEFPDGPKETYMKTLLFPDTANPYKDEYYIHVSYSDLTLSIKDEMTFTETKQNMTAWEKPYVSGLGMSAQSCLFWDTKTSERLSILFHFNTSTDTLFKIAYADYYFSDPWQNFAGANITYNFPVGASDPGVYNMYQIGRAHV